MGARKGAFWTVLSGAFCPIIRKVLVGRELGFVDKCAFWGANWGLDLVSCCGGGVLGEGEVSIRPTRLARLAKAISLAALAQTVAAVSAIASIFMPLAGGIGSQTLVLTGWANTYRVNWWIFGVGWGGRETAP